MNVKLENQFLLSNHKTDNNIIICLIEKMTLVLDIGMLLTGISLAILAYEIHVANTSYMNTDINDKFQQIIDRFDNSWILKK